MAALNRMLVFVVARSSAAGSMSSSAARSSALVSTMSVACRSKGSVASSSTIGASLVRAFSTTAATTINDPPGDGEVITPKAMHDSGGKRRLVVLGCGWAGFRFLYDVDKSQYDVIVVSPRNHFLFTPLLASTTVGTLEFRTVMEPVRSIKGIHYYQATAEKLDSKENTLVCRSVFDNALFSLKYDDLVMAVGGKPQTFNTPGVEKYAHFLREVEDARRIRQDLLACFERASEPSTSIEERKRLLHIVVVGGGPTGIEFTGELYDFLKEDIRKGYPDIFNDVRLTLVEAANTVLSSFDRSLTDYTVSQLQQHSVTCYFGTAVKSITEKEIHLSDGKVIPYGLCVWSTGVTASPFVRSLPFAKDRTGRILTDYYMRAQLQDTGEHLSNVYTIGDCAAIFDLPLPATAQVANQKGKYLAKYFNQKIKSPKQLPFQYHHRGMLAYVGGYKAVGDIPQHPIKGFWSWIFWRSVYLTTLVSVSNKILVPMHWFKSFVFGRDISRF